ncbi:PLDc N-terminal domain-containing protein [Streptomyces lincolnensis]|uniref:PLDc N-terminal domain-containing protein n=1 Tax=Streptomyces lincolnensis TaxID=1915 RepID=UPI0037D95F45
MMMGTLTMGLVAAVVALSLWALIDCVRTPAERVRFVPKLLWVLFLLHTPVFGGLVWTYYGKRRTLLAST